MNAGSGVLLGIYTSASGESAESQESRRVIEVSNEADKKFVVVRK